VLVVFRRLIEATESVFGLVVESTELSALPGLDACPSLLTFPSNLFIISEVNEVFAQRFLIGCSISNASLISNALRHASIQHCLFVEYRKHPPINVLYLDEIIYIDENLNLCRMMPKSQTLLIFLSDSLLPLLSLLWCEKSKKSVMF
jgi:hypothetical protein